jgi:hypothetical protein
MFNYIPISEEKIKTIANKYYSRQLDSADRQDIPTLVLIGGQPGAGKTAAANVAMEYLDKKGGFIHIDADAFHAKIKELKEFDKKDITASQTHNDCKKIAACVRELAVDGCRNVLEEGLFRHPDDLSKRADQFHKMGYRCEVIGVATSRELSRFGVLERREGFRDVHGYVRDVPEAKQDAAYEGFTENLLKGASSFDRVRVINRGGDMLYDSGGGGRYKSVHEALEEGRKLHDGQIAALAKQWADLRDECVKKGIPADELARVDEGTRLFEEFKGAERHRYGMWNLEEYGKVLASDPRYAGHTDEELAKAAFYRGVSEKNQAFEGKTPDIAAIDAALADRTTLGNLPDVDGLAGVVVERGSTKGIARGLGGTVREL